MSEHAPDRLWSGIEITKIIAGTLAAVAAAVVGSFLGVAGTLAGAAVASVVGSIGTEIFQRSLHKGAKRLSTIAPTFVKAPAAVGTPGVAAAHEEDRPSHTVPETDRKRKFRWGHAAVLAAGVFVLAMGAIWMSEKAFGEPLSTKVGVTTTSGTSLGNALGDDSTDDQPQIGTSVAPTGKPANDPAGGPEPTATTAPGDAPAGSPTGPAADPGTGATGDAPKPADPGEQQPNQDGAPPGEQQPNQNVAPPGEQQPNQNVAPEGGPTE